MRLTIIAGNWKMNKTNAEAAELVRGLVKSLGGGEHPRVVICPPYTALSETAQLLKGSRIYLGAQNMYFKETGAFTGEIGPLMLLTIGVKYIILGHSERREYFSETDAIVNEKVKLAVKSGLGPIVCIGEKLEEREKGKTEEVIGRQVDGSLDGLTAGDMKQVVIAYEPVWAIGTGKTATPEMAQEVHRFIRNRIRTNHGDATADNLSILYGGSMNAANAAGLLKQPDIDGGLIGGASLKVEDFTQIVKSA
ncbi:MAG: triose-phosphate isomerase [candidate division Zixibacteria bacterium HGW-Zixibacteria-1]|nr:MAG: triose-phosphate isomerase [candidate division Zixibacteria bacterium HGW-Zixibacteria-1]